jgi:hypothetical protein
LREDIAQRLAADAEELGGAGRDGTRYVFDTGIVLDALLAHCAAGGTGPKSGVLSSLIGFISRALKQRIATDPPSQSSHWSLSYGCHLLRLLPILHRHPHQQTGRDLVAQLLRDFLPALDRGRFPTPWNSSLTYTHAHCYAAEGLLGLYRLTANDGLNLPIPSQRLESIVRECAQWLGEIQQLDGGIPAFYGDNGALGEARGDSTAQAIRLWVAIDKLRFAGAIFAGRGFLVRLMQPCGGLAYSVAVEDINTWVTVFAADAMMLVESAAERAPEVDRIKAAVTYR